MNSKHTPGPWTVNESNFTEVLADGRAPMNTLVANVPIGLPDARLIAAAPEMLEALKQAAEIRSLIARIEGAK